MAQKLNMKQIPVDVMRLLVGKMRSLEKMWSVEACQELMEKVSEADAQMKTHEDESARNAAEHERLSNSVSLLKEELETVKSQLNQRGVEKSALEHALTVASELSARKHKAVQDIEAIKASRKELQNSLAFYQEQNQSHSRSLQEKEQEIQQMLRTIEQKNTQIASLRDSLQTEQSKVSMIKQQFDLHKRNASQLEIKNRSLTSELAQLQEKVQFYSAKQPDYVQTSMKTVPSSVKMHKLAANAQIAAAMVNNGSGGAAKQRGNKRKLVYMPGPSSSTIFNDGNGGGTVGTGASSVTMPVVPKGRGGAGRGRGKKRTAAGATGKTAAKRGRRLQAPPPSRLERFSLMPIENSEDDDDDQQIEDDDDDDDIQ